jgi:nuclear pore complex protein Nup205
MFGSPVGGHDLLQARQLHEKLFPFMNEIQWPLPNFQAGIRAWWLAQYSGFYLEEPPEGVLPANVNLNEGTSIVAVNLMSSLLTRPRGSTTRETISRLG